MLAAYSLRSLRSQASAVLPPAVAMALAVALVTSMTLLIDSVSRVLLRSGRADNALIMEKDRMEMIESVLQPTELSGLVVLPGIATRNGHLFAAPERLSVVRVHHEKTNAPAVAVVRGVDAIAFELHETVRVIGGEMPSPGQPGLVIGEQLLGRFAELKLGSRIRIGRSLWPIVATLSAPGTIYESELWCDRQALVEELRGNRSVNALVARIDQPSTIDAMNARLSAVRGNDTVAITELAFNRRRSKDLLPYVAVAWFLTGVLMIGGAFSIISTIHSLLMRRRRELGTLLAIGFTRRSIVAMLSFESAILILAGAICGAVLTMPLYGRAYYFSEWRIVVHLTPSITPLWFGGALVGAVVLTSIAIASVYVRRLAILDALHSV
jgi:ABC-type antimicrobial peptide transport system permease subunit